MLKQLLLSLAATAGLFLSGCVSSVVEPRAFEIHLSVDKPLEPTSLEVDLIGANALSDLPKWSAYSTADYWQPNNASRRDAAKVTFSFGPGRPSTAIFSRQDLVWRRWLDSGASFLVVIADLPGAPADQNGNADPRRLIVPLDKKLWKRNTPLEILIQESGVRLLTKQKNAKS